MFLLFRVTSLLSVKMVELCDSDTNKAGYETYPITKTLLRGSFNDNMLPVRGE